MPNCEHSGPSPLDGNYDHDWCLATKLCRRCGASTVAVASGLRAEHCEPGVTGISWVRASERFRELIEGPMVSLPLLTMNDVVLGRVTSMSISDPRGLLPPFSIGGFRFPDGSLDDQHDDPPPGAA